MLAVMVAAMALAFISGGYPALHPVIFLSGLCVAVIIGSYSAMTMETPSLVVFLIISTAVAAIDDKTAARRMLGALMSALPDVIRGCLHAPCTRTGQQVSQGRHRRRPQKEKPPVGIVPAGGSLNDLGSVSACD